MNSHDSSNLPVVSMGKFTLLFVSTLGIYSIFWLYQNWMAYERATGKTVFKAFRIIFSVFYIHELFAHIERQNRQSQANYHWSPKSKAWVFISGGVINLLIITIGENYDLQGPTLALCSLLAARLVVFYALYSAQIVINRSAHDPYGKANQTITLANRLAIILGLFLWLNFLQNIYLEMTGQLPDPPTSITPGAESPALNDTSGSALDKGEAPQQPIL